MNNEILQRLVWTEGGDGVDTEQWFDPKTGKTYVVEIEIVRKWDTLEEK